MTPELQSQIAIWRAKDRAGETLTLEEQREAIKLVRVSRLAAVTAESTKRSKAKVAIPDGDSLLEELKGMGL